MTVCPKCKAQLDTDSKFCDVCGFELAGTVSSTEKPEHKKKHLKKLLILSGSALVAVVAVVIAVILILPSSVPQYIFYIKDGELFYADLDKKKTFEVSEDLDAVYSHSVFSGDGKRIFYYDKYSSGDGTYSLYYRDVKDMDKQPTKLDAGINNKYYVNDKGDRVTYLKGDTLYQHDLKERTKISDNVIGFSVSPDGKSIVFIDEQKNVFFADAKNNYKAASNIDTFVYLKDDYKTFYYLKESTLYKQTDGEDNVRIAKDITDFCKVYETGEIFYTKASQTEYKCSDYIFDNNASADNALKAPVAPDPAVPFDEYLKSYESYKKLQAAYLEKLERDGIRYSMAKETFSLALNSLYFYDEANGEKLIADNVMYCSYASDEYPIAVISAVDPTSIDRVNITELKSIDDLEEKIQIKAYSSCCATLADPNGSITLTEKVIYNVSVSEDGKYLCYAITSSNDRGKVFRVETGETVSEPIVYANGVSGLGPDRYILDDNREYVELEYCLQPGFLSDGKIYYAKNEDSKTNRFDLYLGDECIAGKVSYVLKDASRDNTLYYFDDYDADEKSASLKIYKDGEIKTVAEDVYFDYSARNKCLKILSDGSALYFNEMSKSGKGELYYYNGNKSVKVDDDVEVILLPYDFDYAYKEGRKIYTVIE